MLVTRLSYSRFWSRETNTLLTFSNGLVKHKNKKLTAVDEMVPTPAPTHALLAMREGRGTEQYGFPTSNKIPRTPPPGPIFNARRLHCTWTASKMKSGVLLIFDAAHVQWSRRALKIGPGGGLRGMIFFDVRYLYCSVPFPSPVASSACCHIIIACPRLTMNFERTYSS